MVLAVAHPNPWASASSYLSSQSLAASRCNLHAASRSSHSRRSPPCHFFLCRVALFCLVLRCRRLPVPCSRGFFRLSAQLRPPRGISWPLESIELSSSTLGLPISEKRQEAKKKEAAKREAAGRKAAEASLERDEPKLFSVLQRLRQLGRTAEEDQFHRATLEHVAGHGGRGIKRSGHLR